MAKQFIIFAFTFVAIFVLMYAFFGALDLLPDPLTPQAIGGQNGLVEATPDATRGPFGSQSAEGELPVRVVANKVGLDVSVSNTDSTDVDTLDSLLLKGAVRYPTSATLGVEGTVLIFGHSSYLPIVHNQNYKAFDGIQNLKAGDTVSVYSGAYEYRYSVTGVRLADATEDVVELPAQGKHLALVTCDSFGTKSNRWVVTADLMGVYSK